MTTFEFLIPLVDNEFQSLIPPLADHELAQLEANLLRDGCIDPLVVWRERNILLDGHNRKVICEEHGLQYQTKAISLPDRDAAKRWIIEQQFGRRNLTPYQRSELALKLKPLIAEQAKEHLVTSTGGASPRPCQNSDKAAPIDTKKEIAKIAGVSHDTIAKAEFIDQHADEGTKEKLRRGQSSIHAEYRLLKKVQVRQERAARQAQTPPADSNQVRLICADAAHAAQHIEAESVDWIITDPPYPKEFLELYGHLAALADHALKPGGSLIAMVGQSYLPEIIACLAWSDRLSYQWTLAYLTPGGQAAQMWQRRVNTFWKPLLWFVKGSYAGDWIGDVCRSDTNDNDKRFHEWGQSESGMGDIIERFTLPGQTVLDPFMGAGTTGVVAVRMKRRFVGLDVDSECVEKARRRISQAAGGPQ
ncbi:MAG TPA: DNA modification methylase [Planctomycetota bacterium]|nr:DNA modification methylase [Planctomycetota bacterium]